MTHNPHEKRERIRQDELKNNPTGNIRDAAERDDTFNLVDLVGKMGWKGTGGLILALVVFYIIFALIN